MKIAIPIDEDEGLDSKIVGHFGRCVYFMILDKDFHVLEVVENDSIHNRGKLLPPEFLKSHQVTDILCQSLGPKALKRCKELKIKVYIDPLSQTVLDILQKYKKNILNEAEMDQTCKEHRQ